MTSTFFPYRPAPPSLNFSSQAMNPTQKRRYNLFRYNLEKRRKLNTGKFKARGRALLYNARKYTGTNNGILGGTNADQRLVYRKKNMPKRMKKRWRSFIKKVNAVDEKDLGTRTVLINDLILHSYTSGQGCQTLALYGFVNSVHGYTNDMNAIGQLENEGNPTAAAGATIERNSKIIFKSAVMDITLRNVSTVKNAENVEVLAPDAAIELDIYEMLLKKDTSDNTVRWNSVSGLLNAYDEQQIGGGGVGIGIGDRGCTPFEQTSALGRNRMTVTKKTKYFIPNGQTITWQCRDPKRHVCRYGDLEVNDGWVKPGWTKVYYLVYKLVPGLSVGTAIGEYQGKLAIGNTRKYSYKVEGFNEPRERYLGASYLETGQV